MTAYCVHAKDDAVARPHRMEAEGYVDAALAYAERWLGEAGDAPVTLFVQDEESGCEHCLTIDLATGAAAACG